MAAGNCGSRGLWRHVNYGTKMAKLCRRNTKCLPVAIRGKGVGGGGAVAGREACPAKRDVDVALQVVVVGDEWKKARNETKRKVKQSIKK